MTYVYEVNLTLPSTFAPGLTSTTDWVQGTISTDCNNCLIGAHDIVDWNLTVAVHGWPTGVLTASNSTLYFMDLGNLAATPVGMFANFGPGYNWAEMAFSNNSNGFTIAVNNILWNATDQVTITTDIINPTNDFFATYVGVAAVPEPATWLLLLIGLALLGRAGRSWKPRPALAARDCSHL